MNRSGLQPDVQESWVLGAGQSNLDRPEQQPGVEANYLLKIRMEAARQRWTKRSSFVSASVSRVYTSTRQRKSITGL